jgi:exo-beta-1,3-glucanase (GH17 family)
MKSIIRRTELLLIIFSVLLLNSCKKEEVPTLTTSAITNITGTSATSGGTIISEGSRKVISRGVCWGTGIDPTISDNKTTDSAGTGSFTSIISGLKGASKYYIRAYATNSVGTAYGNEISFATNSTFTGPIFYNNNGKIINAVCYGPFRDGQAPGSVLTETQIKEDLLIIKNHWDAIRLYISDDNSENILKVITDNNIDLKVLLGIWISGKTPIDNASQVDRAIALTNAYRNIVQAVSCGNEIFISPESDIYVSNLNEIVGYLQKIHDQTTVPVTIDDLYLVWLDPNYSELVTLQDFLAIHIYGQSDNVSLENTVSFINEKYNELKTLFPQKQILITETGWTTSKNAGQFNPVTVADEVSQKQFYTECQQWSNSNQVSIFYFEAFNERWKGATATEAETNWGFYYADRMPKLVFQGGK